MKTRCLPLALVVVVVTSACSGANRAAPPRESRRLLAAPAAEATSSPPEETMSPSAAPEDTPNNDGSPDAPSAVPDDVPAAEATTDPGKDDSERAVGLPAHTIEGRLLTTKGEPAHGACVRVWNETRSTIILGEFSPLTANGDGRYRIDDTIEDRVYVAAGSCENLSADVYSRAFHAGPTGQPRLVDVSREGSEGIDVVLPLKGWIEGRVTDRNGVPRQSVLVMAHTVSGVRDPAEATTRADGSFEMRVDHGTYLVEFRLDTFAPDPWRWIIEWYDDAAEKDDATPLVVGEAQTVTVDGSL